MCRINTAIMIEVAIIIILTIMRLKISFQVFSTNGKIDTLILSMILNGSFLQFLTLILCSLYF